MKKLLLILALLAYVAISCDDKPTNLTDDGTNTENPTVADKSADTCRILITGGIGMTLSKVYKNASEEINFEASVMSMFRHLTLTLKNGDYATAIGSDFDIDPESTFDTGITGTVYHNVVIDSLKYGKYVIVFWKRVGGTAWGPNYFSDRQSFIYHEITFNEHNTSETFFSEALREQYLRNAKPLTFTEF